MGTKSGSTTQSTEPPAWQVPYLKEGMEGAQELYQQGAPEFYPGQTYAGFNPLQQQAQQGLVNYAGQLDPMVQNLMRTQGYFGPESLSPDTNPYLSQYAQAAIRPIEQSLTENILPALRGSAIGAGQYGGSRQSLGEGLAVGRATQAMGDVTSNIYNQAYQTGTGNMLRGLAMAPTTMQAGAYPAGLMSQVGAQQQGMEQQGITEGMQRHYYPYESQMQNIQQYMQNVGGGFGSTTQQPYYSNQGAGALGGAMGGAGLAMMMGFNPFLGAGLGLATGVL